MLSAAAVLKVQTRYPVPGNEGWDYITVDSGGRRSMSLTASASMCLMRTPVRKSELLKIHPACMGLRLPRAKTWIYQQRQGRQGIDVRYQQPGTD